MSPVNPELCATARSATNVHTERTGAPLVMRSVSRTGQALDFAGNNSRKIRRTVSEISGVRVSTRNAERNNWPSSSSSPVVVCEARSNFAEFLRSDFSGNGCVETHGTCTIGLTTIFDCYTLLQLLMGNRLLPSDVSIHHTHHGKRPPYAALSPSSELIFALSPSPGRC